jgi:copper chaperone NosL
MDYLNGSFQPGMRRWILLAAIVLLPVFFLPVLPIWTMRLWAPQYREGLSLVIFANTIRGDLQSINTLNHYVGMKAIRAEDFHEFSYMPQLLSLFGVMALAAALLNRRWVAMFGWLLFSVFAGLMFADFGVWLWHYGHDLDPHAPITLPAFTPPFIGLARMANFRVLSLPGPGTLLLGVAWLLGPVVMWLDHRAARVGAAPPRAAAVAAAG